MKYEELTPEQQACFDEYEKEMREIVIPQIIEEQRLRAKRLAETWHHILGRCSNCTLTQPLAKFAAWHVEVGNIPTCGHSHVLHHPPGESRYGFCLGGTDIDPCPCQETNYE